MFKILVTVVYFLVKAVGAPVHVLWDIARFGFNHTGGRK